MVSVLVSSAVDRGFEPRSVQTKDYKIGMCCFSDKHTALRRKSKTGRLGIRIMCLSGATYLPTDCCFSELSKYVTISKHLAFGNLSICLPDAVLLLLFRKSRSFRACT